MTRLTRRDRLTVRKHTPKGMRDRMEGTILPEGSGGEEPPEELRALEVYNARMWLFQNVVGEGSPTISRRRRVFRDYTTKNCEESWGYRTW